MTSLETRPRWQGVAAIGIVGLECRVLFAGGMDRGGEGDQSGLELSATPPAVATLPWHPVGHRRYAPRPPRRSPGAHWGSDVGRARV